MTEADLRGSVLQRCRWLLARPSQRSLLFALRRSPRQVAITEGVPSGCPDQEQITSGCQAGTGSATGSGKRLNDRMKSVALLACAAARKMNLGSSAMARSHDFK